MNPEPRRAIPSVDKVLRELGSCELPRASLLAVIRQELESVRAATCAYSSDQLLARIRAAIDTLLLARIRPVINGTGVILHTNLGRSPMGQQVVTTLSDIAANYNNLELDLASGERSGRAAYLEHNLAVLCGAQAATVVNNCAAALVLILRHFTSGFRKQVIISRGELIQIGGGFRIPEILEASGATIREVGTTNKTSLADYEGAVSDDTAMLLKVHRSNFHMEGFVESPETDQLAAVARGKRIPFVEDLGSGATFRTEVLADIEHEPMPAEILARGVDLVCFSGDKLFGGPQAGIIAGNTEMIAALKREPFFRALRCDKLILSAMQATVDLHLRAPEQRDKAADGIPILDMLSQTTDSLRMRAQTIADSLSGLATSVVVGVGASKIGGGTLPKASIPSITLDLLPRDIGLQEFSAKLRRALIPVIGFISENRFKLDLRTVFPRQDEQLVDAIRSALTAGVRDG
jgi:L-seryl-tRNA(Ser) seleniumtransferase